ncbi:MAG: hypothetical protein WBW93_20085 [Steroidobacteraceae bacterium]
MTWTSLSLSALMSCYGERQHRLAGALLALLLLPFPALGFTAQVADTGPAKAKLSTVTIEAAREHALRLKVDHFVTSVVVQPWNDTLYRWNDPICPLVAGLPKAFGKFILERISKAARDAHAPLAGSVCNPNLYVVATDDPDQLLKMWWKRDRQMYNTQFIGIEGVRHFINSTRPIRVWYNTSWGCGMGAAARPPPTISVNSFALPGVYAPPGCDPFNDVDTHLTFGTIHSDISTAIVVIDGRQMKNITIGQMADYIALVVCCSRARRSVRAAFIFASIPSVDIGGMPAASSAGAMASRRSQAARFLA